MAIELNQTPPMDEVWKVGDVWYLVRFVPGEPPIPIVWRVRADDVEALGIKKANRTLDQGEFNRTGALPMGDSRELLNTTEDPVDAIYSNYKTEVRVKPWLADPEILSLWMGAALEGRSISDAELQGTEWWRTHTEGERQWLSLNASDPATAQQVIADNRARVSDLLTQAGVDNASQDLITTIADSWTTGSWTETYAVNQIRLLADPHLDGDLDPTLRDFRDGLDPTRVGEEDVRQMIQTWLGPAHGANWNDEHIASWASRFREDPDARLELTEVLRRHRLALFPEYENENLTYEDIAAPWRGVWQQEWGGVADETDPLFSRIVRANDVSEARRLLRTEGLERGNNSVAQRLLSELGPAFGGQVRSADPAIR